MSVKQLVIGMMVLGLTACSQSMVPSVGQSMISATVTQECHKQLDKRVEWQTAKLLVSPDKAKQWEQQVCNCVGEEAPNYVSMSDVATAVTNPSERVAIGARVAEATLTACVKKIKF
ncbi:MAG: hypothetical protein KBC57_00715 [Neisseriaceae bacterium]|nr:hypothetical protein [Neisseriaceae bacterium]